MALSRGMFTAVATELFVLWPLLTGFEFRPISGATVRFVPGSASRTASGERIVFEVDCCGSLFSSSADLTKGGECCGEVLPEADFLPEIGRFNKLLGRLRRLLRLVGGNRGGRGGSTQGENRYLIQSSTLKKSTGYFSLVFISTKQ